MNESHIRNVIEAALLAAGKPLQAAELVELFDEGARPPVQDIKAALTALMEEYSNRGIEIKETAAGFRIQVRREMANEISRLWPERPARYSRALLETLALIAYRQPITRAEIEAVRGVAVNPNILKTVIERNWVRVVGHRDVPGRPELLGTTRDFLDYFGLKTLDELPPLAELKVIGDIKVQFDLPDPGPVALAGDGNGVAGAADAAGVEGLAVGAAGAAGVATELAGASGAADSAREPGGAAVAADVATELGDAAVAADVATELGATTVAAHAATDLAGAVNSNGAAGADGASGAGGAGGAEDAARADAATGAEGAARSAGARSAELTAGGADDEDGAEGVADNHTRAASAANDDGDGEAGATVSQDGDGQARVAADQGDEGPVAAAKPTRRGAPDSALHEAEEFAASIDADLAAGEDDGSDDDELSASGPGSSELVAGPRDIDD